MNQDRIVVDIVTIIALIAGPIIAVVISLILQKKLEKDKERHQLFSVLMSHQWDSPPTQELATALNMIDICFHQNLKIVGTWHKLLDSFCQIGQNRNRNTEEKLYFEILSQMAKVLKYENLNLPDISRRYFPAHLADQKMRQEEIQKENLIYLKKMNAVDKSNSQKS